MLIHGVSHRGVYVSVRVEEEEEQEERKIKITYHRMFLSIILNYS